MQDDADRNWPHAAARARAFVPRLRFPPPTSGDEQTHGAESTRMTDEGSGVETVTATLVIQP